MPPESTAAAFSIQKWARFQKHRLICKLAQNAEDPITLESIQATPPHQLFTYFDGRKIWAYDGPAWAQWILKHRQHPLTKNVLDARTMHQCFKSAAQSALHSPQNKELRACLEAWMRPVRLVHIQRNDPRPTRLLQSKWRKPRTQWGLILYVSPLYKFMGAEVDVQRALVVRFDVEPAYPAASSSSSSVARSYQDRILDGGKGFVAVGSTRASALKLRCVLKDLSKGTLTEAELNGVESDDDDDDEDWDEGGEGSSISTE